MIKSTITEFMTTHQKAALLRKVDSGLHVEGWLLEGLQDLGLIDHKDNVTPEGKEIMRKGLSL